MDNEEIKPLLVKYISGEAGDNEIEQVKEWINAHPENEQYFVQLYETWHNVLYLQPQLINKDNAFQQFSSPGKRNYLRLIKWASVAAVIALFISVTFILVNRRTKRGTETLKQIAVNKGAIEKIVLTDGTLVWLNAGSKLNYSTDFGKTSRTVYLEGEAFFEIAPGAKTIPFIVSTRNYVIRDIGTKFNLKAYPNDPFFETTVVKGEVSVEGNMAGNARESNRIYVKPRQVLRIYYRPEIGRDTDKARIYNEIRVLQVDSAKLDKYDGWKDDLMVFDGNTLDEISKVLERRYDVKIEMDDTGLKNIRYSGSFKNVASISKVLDIIKYNTAIDYSTTGSIITITRNQKTN